MANYSEVADCGPSLMPDGFQIGSIRVVPYGVLWSDMKYTTDRQFPGRFILWVESEEAQGEPAFHLEARYTRVGMDLKGKQVDLFGGITGGGKVEIDFLGNFTTENQPDTRLRHAYFEAKNEHVRFLVGQYWDLVSPLLPNTVNFSVNWGVGNIGFRRAQFRVERYFHVSDHLKWTLQGALAQNVIQDLVSGPLSADVTRETGSWPMIQARTAVTLSSFCCDPITVGCSGHIGETGFDFRDSAPGNPSIGPQDDARFRTWSINADMKLPITDCFGFQGELFHGANLSPLLGGIVQGVCPCERVPIRSIGGWGEVYYNVTPCIHLHAGFGIDDPNDRDSLIGRTNNRVIYGNVFFDLTDHLITGLEVSNWRTGYQNQTAAPNAVPFPTAPGEATTIDWTVRYKF
jgi:hypothetical protein